MYIHIHTYDLYICTHTHTFMCVRVPLCGYCTSVRRYRLLSDIPQNLAKKVRTVLTRSTANTAPYFFLKSRKCRSATRGCITCGEPEVKWR